MEWGDGMTDTNQFSGALAFFSSYLLRRALNLWYCF